MLEDFRLKVFMAVAAERSFTKAAAALGISQPAVSQNISELEKVMDIRLFDRLRGEVSITPQGRIFMKLASGVLDSYEEMNRLFCNPRINGRSPSMPLRIYVSPLLEDLLMRNFSDCVRTLRPSLAIEKVNEAGIAHVRILSLIEKKDADLNIKVNVLSDDSLLQSFFRQVVDYCLSDAFEPTFE